MNERRDKHKVEGKAITLCPRKRFSFKLSGMNSRRKRIAGFIAGLLILASGVGVFLFFFRNQPPVEFLIDPRTIHTEVDGTIVIPYPKTGPYRKFGKFYSSGLPLDIFVNIITPTNTTRQLAPKYFGNFDNKMAVFIYPPNVGDGTCWSIEFKGSVRKRIGLKPFQVTWKGRDYVWRTPQFTRGASSYREYNAASGTIAVGTEVFRKFGDWDFAPVGSVQKIEPRHAFPDSVFAPGFQILFRNGAADWYSREQLTDFLVLPE